MQRTTVPFLYNLEGFVDGLSIADFPGVDDNDDNVVGLSSLLLQLSQLVILVIDYRYGIRNGQMYLSHGMRNNLI